MRTRDRRSARRRAPLVTAGVLLAAAGCLAVVLGVAGVPASGIWLAAGLAAAGLGAVLLRFDGPADWWPGMRVKGL